MAEEVTTATTAEVTAQQQSMSVQQETTGAQVNVNQNNVTDANDLLTQVATEGQSQQTQETVSNKEEGQTTSTSSLEQAQKSLDAAEQDLTQKGVDFKALEDEYQRTGSLSADSYNKLANAGYPKEVVDGVLNGWSAAADAFVAQVVTAAGGDAELARMQKFVSTQGDAYIKAYNDAINTNDIGKIQLVFDGIKSKMTQVYGTSNPTLMGTTAGALPQQSQGYETTEEMIKDMADPRYQKDMNFTREVYRKVNNAKFY